MAELRGDLSLDTSDAESQIEQLEPIFESVGVAFSQALIEAIDVLQDVPAPELDTSAIEASLTASGEAGAESIAAALADIDAPEVDVPVTVDTSEAQTSIDDLAASAEAAVGSTSDLSGSVGSFGDASSIATGSAAGLGSVADDLAGKFGVAGGIITATAGAVAIFFNEAVDAQGATQRFEAALGPMADEVENLRNIEGLNTNLSELALTLGSDDDKVRTVAARLFELATNSGVAEDAASTFTQQVIAMGARAVAVNPNLGDLGDVADGLSTAFVRGGRFATKYGLDLNQAEINARALNDTGKATTEELTFVEKAMAGASIASEKYGDNLDKIVARGAENAVTTQRRLKQEVRETIEALGTPLVAPIFELLDEVQPIVESVGTLFQQLALGALPTLIAVTQALVPVLQALSSIIERLPDPIVASAAALLLLRGSGHPLLLTLGVLLPLLTAIDPALTQLAVAAVGAVLAVRALGIATSVSNPLLAVFTATVIATSFALTKLIGSQKDLTEELDTYEGAVTAATRATDGGLVKAYENAQKALGALLREQGQATEKTIRLGAATTTFTDIAKEDLGTAIRLAEQYKGNAPVYERMIAVIQQQAAAQAQANAGSQAATEIIAAQTASVDALAEQISTQVPTAAGVFQQFASDVQAAFGETAEPSVQGFVDRLVATKDEVATWLSDIKGLLASGLTGLAQAVLTEGPGGALAREIRDSTPEQRDAWNFSIQQATIALSQGKIEVGALSQTVIDEYAKAMGQAPEITASTFGQVGTVIGQQTPAVAGAAAATGTAAAGQYGQAVGVMGAETGTALQGAAAVMDQGASIVGSPANIAGLIVGQQFGAGIVSGIHSYIGRIEDAARAAVNAAERAARAEAESRSPSRVFMRVGQDLTSGLAQGMEQGASDVVAVAEQIVRDAAAVRIPVGPTGFATAGSALTAAAAGTGGVTSITFDIDVHGVADAATARAVGEAVGEGAIDALSTGLVRRRVVMAARTGGG